MCFVDDHERWPGDASAPSPAEELERNDVGPLLNSQKRLAPETAQGRGRDDEHAFICSSGGERDVGLAEARLIGEDRDTVAREQLLNSRQGLLLVRMKRDVAETNVRRRRAEHRARDAGPDASQCLFGALFGAHGLACEPGEKGLDVGPFQAVRVETRLEQVDSTFPSAVWTAESL